MSVELPYQLKEDDLLCFIHIGKTGGLTLLPILDAMFEPAYICNYHNITYIKDLSPENLARYRLIRAHGTYNDFRALRQKTPIFMTFLRNPLQHAMSVYLYIKRTPEHPLHETLKHLTFTEYVLSDRSLTTEINNLQTRVLTSTMNPVAEPDLELAKSRLRDEFVFIGLTEAYEVSLKLLSFTFNWPPITDYEIKNVSVKPDNYEEMLHYNHNRLVELNQFDLELYEYGKKLFEERVQFMYSVKYSEKVLSTNQRIKALFDQTRSKLNVIFEGK